MPWALIIGFAISLIEKGTPAITKMVESLRRSGELTNEEAAAFDARIAAAEASDAWKTDAQLEAGKTDPVKEAIDGTPLPDTP